MQYKQLLKFITPHRNTILLIVVMLLGVTAANLATPLFAGKVTAVLLAEGGSTQTSVGYLLAAWLLLLIFRAVFSILSRYLTGTTGANMSSELRRRVYEHMQILPLQWFQERKQGDVLSLLSHDAETISRFVTDTLVQLLPQLLTLVFAFAVMAWLDPVIALTAVLLLPAYTIVTRLIGRRIRPLSKSWVESWSGLVALVNENLGLIPVLKASTREPYESDRFARRNSDLLDVSRKQIWLTSLLSPIIGLLAGAGALLLLWIGILHVEDGQLQASDLVVLMLYVMLLTTPLSVLAGVYGQVMHTRGAAERLLEFFGEQPEPFEQGGLKVNRVDGNIEFREVHFAYEGQSPVLMDFNLAIKAGETIALTGPNGSGKSTLVQLLLRFISPQEGHILLDGMDIREIELTSLRSRIGLVAQNTLLMNGSVAENIAYAQPDATHEEIGEAARIARMDSILECLPDGLDTVIGDQGVKLSGGQRQRLSLARTLLRAPEILILDEATSMFDPASEHEFMRAFRTEFSNQTVILVSHHPSTLELADRVIDMGTAHL